MRIRYSLTHYITCGPSILAGKSLTITSFVEDNSHDLSPTKSRMFRNNRKINLKVKRTLEMNDDASVRLNKSFASLVHQAGGYDNLQFGEREIMCPNKDASCVKKVMERLC